MSFDSDDTFKVCNPDNYFDDTMSADRASIGVNLCALNALAWETEQESIIYAYYALSDFVAFHPENRKIMRFID
ncbi:antirestriction protein [Aliikangiella sp. IMCC44359]|uniref:antirestriction protein n=1 Tax=Aliikangiella sp. IMCC44359 TaxID=3459125 RepID=UPI00403A8F35